MEAKPAKAGWGLWCRWAIGGFLGWVVGVVAAIGLSYAMGALFHMGETNLFVGIFMGACMGLAQFLVVRGVMPLGARWVWGAVVGMGAAFVAAVLLGAHVLQLGGPIDYWLIPVAVVGGVLAGLLQKDSLRPYAARHNLWPLASGASWGVAWIAANFTGGLGFLIAGAVFGVVSGLLIVWLVRSQ